MNKFSKAIALAVMTSVAVLPTFTYANTATVAGTEQQATQQLANLLSGLNSMTADFEQKTTAVNSKSGKQQRSLTTQQMNQTFTGEMKVERPGKFYWQTNKPAKQTIITTGSTVWIYDPDLKQAVRQKLDTQVANTPALLLSGDTKKIMQTYKVSQPDARIMYYVLHPKDKDGVFQSLAISFGANKAPNHMVLQDNMGQTTHIKFKQVKVNPKIAPTTFNFTPPKGTDIIDQ